MFNKVKVKKGALDHFRRLAREAAPKEIQAYLVGKIVSVDSVEITEFAYPKVYHTQAINEVCWYEEEYKVLKNRVEASGERIIGDIHSHPQWDAVMSLNDYKSAITESLAVCGICSIYGKRTRVRFWTPTSALPCSIIYS